MSSPGVKLGREIDVQAIAEENVVATGDLERSVNLNQLVIELGFEQAEYEPEQLPGVIYRAPDLPAVVLTFGSGRSSLRSRTAAAATAARCVTTSRTAPGSAASGRCTS